MTPEIIEKLSQQEEDQDVEKLRRDIQKWLRHSRGRLKERWLQWDKNFCVFKGERVPDESDLEAMENEEPAKMVVPMSYTQVMTFVTYCFFQLKQNPTGFFQFGAVGNEDYPLEEVNVTMLDRDLNHNDWSQRLFQILLDAGIYGMFATKTTWDIKEQMVPFQAPVEASVIGEGAFEVFDVPEVTEMVPVTKYEGNKVEVVSPFNIIPDMRLPLSRWKEGRFCADEQEYHISRLDELEDEGVYAGVKYVEGMTKEGFEKSNRHKNTFNQVYKTFDKQKKPGKDDDEDDRDFMAISTEGHFRIIPSKYNLGPEDFYVDYLITLVNDCRIVRIEPLNALHGESIYSLGQFLPDQQNDLSMALSDTIDALQEVISYLINSRVEAVRIGLDGKTVVDPRFIDTAGIESRNPVVYVKKNAPLAGVDKFVTQLKVQDTTTSNIPDSESFVKIMQMVTGVNENAMGQYAPGRRSASENRAANQGAASRMNLHCNLIWEQCLAPTGSKMLTNLRQGISFETFVKVIGETSPIPGKTLEELFALFAPSDPRILVGSEDFFVYDNQSLAEKTFLAQALQELVGALVANPMALTLTNYDLTKLIDSIQQLRGVRNVARFKNPAPIAPSLVQPPAAPGNGALPSNVSPIAAPPAPPNGIPGVA